MVQKGIGFLYASTMDFDSYLHGGDQEQKKRAGTENLRCHRRHALRPKED